MTETPPPWPWRRGLAVPPRDAATWFHGRVAGALLSTLLWRRGVESAAEARRFLFPRLSTDLRPPAVFPGVPAAGERLAALVAHGGALRLAVSGGTDALLGAAVFAAWLGAAGARVTVDHGESGDLVVGDGGLRIGGVSLSVASLAVPLAVAGAALYVCAAARAAQRAAGQPARAPLGPLLDLVALGTLLSGRPLREENRVLAYAGLRRWRQGPRPGLAALATMAAVESPSGGLVAERLGPRIRVATAEVPRALLALLLASDRSEAERLAAMIEMRTARGERPPQEDIDPALLDAEISLDDLTPGVLLALARLEPHGVGNPEPLLLVRGVALEGARLVGAPERPFWRLRLRQGNRSRRAVAPLSGVPAPDSGRRYDVACVPRLGSRHDRPWVELRIRALRPVHGEKSAS